MEAQVNFTQTNLVGSLPTSISSLNFSGIQSSIETLAAALDVLISLEPPLESVHPLATALSAGVSPLQGIIDQFTISGVIPRIPSISWTTVHPYIEGVGTYNPTLNVYGATPQVILEQMAFKLDDLQDIEQLGFSGADVAGGIIGIGTPSGVGELITLLDAINGFIDLPELQYFADLVKDSQDSTSHETALNPLWGPQELNNFIPGFDHVMAKLNGLIGTLEQSATGALEAKAFLGRKFEKKSAQLGELNTIVGQLTTAFTTAAAISGFHWACVTPAAGGITNLRDGLLNSNLASNESTLSFGFMGVGDSENLTLFQTLLGL